MKLYMYPTRAGLCYTGIQQFEIPGTYFNYCANPQVKITGKLFSLLPQRRRTS